MAIPMQPQALIFDCDGTLTDSMPLHFLAWHRVMNRHGVEFSEDRFYALGGMPSEKIIAMLSDEFGLNLNVALLTQEKEEGFLEHLHLLEEIPVVTQVARDHRGRLPMAVASGGLRHITIRRIRSPWSSSPPGRSA